MLSYFYPCLCPLLFALINFGSRRLYTIQSTHCPPLCQANHSKHLVAFGLATFGFVASRLASFNGTFSAGLCPLMVLGLVVAGSMVLPHNLIFLFKTEVAWDFSCW